ncbi:OmpH family outer membrane protein [Limimaricola hongkongensis]|uniref:Outer membrane protein H n=1 Tax=Limimaricola hongkongensis DSM 17492 TaxID=1122180 RepID=A0A017HBS4_9RHOB|nr:OmpH family outer membrane protein [Limimaricola hongkongensis]EYD71765.1 Outer membrane protein H precursor [Limimaricola hongkongensis DSM 17492]
MRRLAAALGLVAALGAPAFAQRASDAPVPAPAPQGAGGIVVLDTERLFSESAFGQRFAADLQAQTEALIEENRRIEDELKAEEQALTERRATMDPAAFSAEADVFDAKVQQIRRERDAKERALQQEAAAGRETFLAAAGPALGQVMLARGAAVILDRRAVFLSTGAVDITDAALAAVDAAIGDGSQAGSGTGDDEAPVADPEAAR